MGFVFKGAGVELAGVDAAATDFGFVHAFGVGGGGLPLLEVYLEVLEVCGAEVLEGLVDFLG
nr:hypothetical protein [Rappaport israeli]